LAERIDGFRSLEQVLSISGDVVGLHAALGKLIGLGMVAVEGESDVEMAPQRPAAAVEPALVPRQKPAPAPGMAQRSPVATPAPVTRTAAPAKPVAAAPTKPAPPQPSVRSAAPQPTVAPPATPAAAATAKPAVANAKPAPAVAASSAPKPAGAKPSAAATELAQAKALLRVEANYLFGGNAERAKKVIDKVDACKSVEEIFDVIVKLQGALAKSGKVDPNVFIDRLTSGLSKLRASHAKTPHAA
jgi:predicted component of type VI protein secretion system